MSSALRARLVLLVFAAVLLAAVCAGSWGTAPAYSASRITVTQ